MKLQRFGFWVIYVTLVSIGLGLIVSAYVNWFKNPDMTYMEMTIKHVWHWIGAMACAVASIYIVTRNEYS
jgi:ABC-type sugar transport system permease subunit